MDTIAETIKFNGFGKKKAMAKQIQMKIMVISFFITILEII
ncbi:hypothetical protein [Lysinibacillus capsici]|nr:hypothetical protein [Lysinibacillus capsici]